MEGNDPHQEFLYLQLNETVDTDLFCISGLSKYGGCMRNTYQIVNSAAKALGSK